MYQSLYAGHLGPCVAENYKYFSHTHVRNDGNKSIHVALCGNILIIFIGIKI